MAKKLLVLIRGSLVCKIDDGRSLEFGLFQVQCCKVSVAIIEEAGEEKREKKKARGV